MFYKHIRSLSLLAVIAISFIAGLSGKKTIFLPKGFEIKKTLLTQKNTIFGFDIHGVIVNRHYWNTLRKAITNVGMSWELVKDNKIKLTRTQFVSDLCVERLLNHTHAANYVPAFLDMVNSHLPIPGSFSLLKELNRQHYNLYILSNIGKYEFYGVNTEKIKALGLKDRFPEAFSLFKDGVVCAKKPKLDGYREFKTKFNPKNEYVTIFIDDRLENIIAAQQEGMIGILFKNAEQLRKDLCALGIPLA